MSESTTAQSAPRSGSLTALRLPQLQEMAAGLGIKGYRRLRKGELIEAIHNANGPAQATGAPQSHAEAPQTSADQSPEASAAPAAERGPRTKHAGDAASAQGDDNKRNDDERSESPRSEGQHTAAQHTEAQQSAERDEQDSRRGRGRRRDAEDRGGDTNGRGEAQRGDDAQQRESDDDRSAGRRGRNREQRDNNRDENRRRNDNRGGDENRNTNDNRGGNRDGDDNRGGNDSRGDNSHGGDKNNDRQHNEGGRNRDKRANDNRGNNDNRGGNDNRNDNHDERRGRNRRDRKRRGNNGRDDDQDLRPDDVLIPVGGILDVHDNYAFLRTSGYLPGSNDVYVSANMVKRNGLRKGDAVTGAIRQQREGEKHNRREKFDALVRLDTVNGLSTDDAKRRVEFSKLTPLYPQERLRLETESKLIATRMVDLVSPIGKGQRGLIVSPPKAGKTTIMQQVANAITTNNPEVHLMVVLVDERPEEVTDMQRAVKGEVIASTFDRPADDHTTIAELAIERAKRLVEMGQDVVVLLDNITRLGRAYNLAQPASGRILSGGVDANALYPPKKFFGAARNIEGGGSLTILATALVETGSKMDEVIFEEFKGTGNMELRLSRNLADKRIYPAVDVNSSGTRREENLMSAEEMKIMWRLRRLLSGLEQQQAVELLLSKLKETGSNAEFLMQVQKSTPLPKSAADDI